MFINIHMRFHLSLLCCSTFLSFFFCLFSYRVVAVNNFLILLTRFFQLHEYEGEKRRNYYHMICSHCNCMYIAIVSILCLVFRTENVSFLLRGRYLFVRFHTKIFMIQKLLPKILT